MSVETPFQRGNRHETNKIPLKPLLCCLAGFIFAAMLMQVALVGYGLILKNSYKKFGRIYPIRSQQVPQYPSPALQDNPRIDLQTYRARAENDLNSYGWIDQTHGIVKIPIDRAMAIVESEGLPVRPTVQNGPSELDMQNQKASAEAQTLATPLVK